MCLKPLLKFYVVLRLFTQRSGLTFTTSLLSVTIPGRCLVNYVYSSANLRNADVFPIISQAVILWCCSPGWKLLKKTRGGVEGVDSQALFSHSGPATGFNIILLSILGANLLS